MSKDKIQPEKQKIFYWNTSNNTGMSTIAGEVSTGKSSVLKLSKLRKEFLAGLEKPLNEQVVIDRPCSARKSLK
ncbi:MAG: hypothetical protein WAQ98_20325 [Blastocatellia bacterium]